MQREFHYFHPGCSVRSPKALCSGSPRRARAVISTALADLQCSPTVPRPLQHLRQIQHQHLRFPTPFNNASAHIRACITVGPAPQRSQSQHLGELRTIHRSVALPGISAPRRQLVSSDLQARSLHSEGDDRPCPSPLASPLIPIPPSAGDAPRYQRRRRV